MDRFKKIGFGAFAFLALVFGLVQISQNLKLTFATESASPTDAAAEQTFSDAKLKVLDTDNDGLSDWQELNVYGTSPYLADSDSDGLSDSAEISGGSDPNCPKGRECGSGGLLNKPPVDSLLAPALPASEPSAPAAPESALTPEDQQALQALSPQDVRELLRQGGVSEEDLQGASDEDLRQLLEETIKQPQ